MAVLLSGSYKTLERGLVATFTLVTLLCTILLQWTGFAITGDDVRQDDGIERRSFPSIGEFGLGVPLRRVYRHNPANHEHRNPIPELAIQGPVIPLENSELANDMVLQRLDKPAHCRLVHHE